MSFKGASRAFSGFSGISGWFRGVSAALREFQGVFAAISGQSITSKFHRGFGWFLRVLGAQQRCCGSFREPTVLDNTLRITALSL